MSEGTAINAILAQLRSELGRQGLRVPVLAKGLAVAEPTLWRWLRGEGLTLSRLDRICNLIGLDLRDLVAHSRDPGTDRFTLAQERVLAADRGLALLFFSLLHGAGRETWETEFGMASERIEAHLERLRRLGLIDLTPHGRIRPRVARDVRWRAGGPLSAAFNRNIKQFFLSMDYGAPDARYVSEMVRLTENGRARVHALLEDLRGEVHLIAEQERAGRLEGGDWSALFLLIRKLDVAAITHDLHREGAGL